MFFESKKHKYFIFLRLNNLWSCFHVIVYTSNVFLFLMCFLSVSLKWYFAVIVLTQEKWQSSAAVSSWGVLHFEQRHVHHVWLLSCISKAIFARWWSGTRTPKSKLIGEIYFTNSSFCLPWLELEFLKQCVHFGVCRFSFSVLTRCCPLARLLN